MPYFYSQSVEIPSFTSLLFMIKQVRRDSLSQQCLVLRLNEARFEHETVCQVSNILLIKCGINSTLVSIKFDSLAL